MLMVFSFDFYNVCGVGESDDVLCFFEGVKKNTDIVRVAKVIIFFELKKYFLINLFLFSVTFIGA